MPRTTQRIRGKRRIFYAENIFQEIVFTVIMVFFMVYAMICYNIALETGGLAGFVFVAASKSLR